MSTPSTVAVLQNETDSNSNLNHLHTNKELMDQAGNTKP